MSDSSVYCIEEKVAYLEKKVKSLEKEISDRGGFYCRCWYCEEHRISGVPVGCKVED